MVRLRNQTGIALSLCLGLTCFGVGSAFGQNAADSLRDAIKLFDNGSYVEAQEMLAGLDRSKLNDRQQAQRDDYLNRVQVAINLHEKALRDLEDAETALAGREYDRAKELLNGVLDNEYAAASLRRAARAHLRDLNDRNAVIEAGEESGNAAQPETAATTTTGASTGGDGEPVAPAIQPVQPATATARDADRARILTQEGDALTREGNFTEARLRYDEALGIIPGFPDAVDGLAALGQHQRNQGGVRADSLAERIRRRDAINWQRAVVQYRNAEQLIRTNVERGEFDEAQQTLARARQMVQAAKQFADPLVKYDNLHNEVQSLTTFVRDQERTHNEDKVAKTRREIEERRSQRLQEVETERARQVEMLMKEALRHRKDGDLDAAINVLRQVTVIDPKHRPARWMMDMLEDARQFRRQKNTRNDYYEMSRRNLEGVEEAKVPWFEEIRYPDDWLERLSRPERMSPTESRADRLLFGALDREINVDIDRVPFDQAITRLAEANRINMTVNWHDIRQAGVDPTTTIDLKLPREITLKKALSEILDQAGGGKQELGFEVEDGVITVATREFLNKKTFPKIYPVLDLLMEVPDFTEAPAMDLRNLKTSNPVLDSSGNRPWQRGDDDDDESDFEPHRDDRVKELVHLIQDTIAPDSWRANGGTIGSINEINGQLVVTQNSAAHQQIRGLLQSLRQERAIQVSVEALFITVSSHYLEEMGMDLDIILNAGNAGIDFLNGGLGPATDPVLGNRLLLPRQFTRLGFSPNTPAQGTALGGAIPLSQPFGSPALVPARAGGSGSQWTPIPILSNILDFTNPANLTSDIPGSFAGQNIGPALNVFGSFLDNIQVDFLVRATQADSRSSVLTAPRVVVFNGASAWIAVTIQQNFVSALQPVVAQGAVAQAPVTQTIDAGASLFVRATVTADKRYVMMLVAPGVTRLLSLQTFQFSGGTGAGQAFVQLPTLSAQRIQTMVSVPDGGTLLIGGQKLSSEQEIESGVPILSKIPILKRVYSARSMVKDEQTLLILIKPKILIQSEQENLAFPSFTQR